MLRAIMPIRRSGCHAVHAVLRRALLVLLLASPQLGCAYALISDGQIHPGRMAALEARTARFAGWREEAPYRAETLLRAELPTLVAEVVEQAYPESELQAMQRAVEVMGYWPIGLDYVEEMVRITGAEAAGVYVPDRRTLYVVTDAPIPFGVRMLSAMMGRDLAREEVLSHEILHAYQHAQHPALFDFAKQTRQSDPNAAIQAAVEGDATRRSLAIVLQDPGLLPDADAVRRAYEAEVTYNTSRPIAEAPDLLRLTLAFPYARGYGLSLREGDTLLQAPPASTEQVMHVDRRDADFWAIDLGAAGDALPEGCSVVYEDTLGELLISVLLRDHAGEGQEAAWEGWDGDRALVAECDGRGEFVWWTEWDSAADAEEFASAYRAIAAAVMERAQLAAPPRVALRERRVTVSTDGLEPHLAAVEGAARRARVTTLDELAAHYGIPSPLAPAAEVDAAAAAPLIRP